LKRIGLTQRVSSNVGGQPHDCLDASWSEVLLKLRLVPVPLPNIDASEDQTRQILEGFNLDGLVLTGGNDLAGFGAVVGSEVSPRRDTFEGIAVGWARSTSLPLVAVCRGFQHLNVLLGGDLSRTTGHAGVRHRVLRLGRGNAWSIDLPDVFLVNSFHNFVIPESGLADCLRPLVVDENGHVEAAEHVSEPIFGMMWHPERPNPADQVDRTILKSLFGR
jgi:putative glutamine amidotransferase